MKLFEQIASRFSRVEPLPEGTHHKQDLVDEKPYRIHLRLHKDGSGVLIVNATTVLQLNPTAAEYAYHFIRGSSPEEAARHVSGRYRVNRAAALADYGEFTERIHTLLSTPDLDPVSYLDFDRAAPHSTAMACPLRLDCALTYRLPQGSKADLAPVKRVDRELTTAEWSSLIDRAWQAGIPQIVFTGGEATLREDLPALIAHVEGNGQVCGLLTDGLKLADESYLDLLLQTGLDHVMLILQPDEPRAWKAIETILPRDLFITVHLTLTRQNLPGARAVLERMAGLGVRHISLSSAEPDLSDELLDLQGFAGSLELSLHWDLPVPYSASNPVGIETADDQVPSGAGRAWLYVEPDGDVLPTQAHSQAVLGNLLRDDWASIWQSAQERR